MDGGYLSIVISSTGDVLYDQLVITFHKDLEYYSPKPCLPLRLLAGQRNAISVPRDDYKFGTFILT